LGRVIQVGEVFVFNASGSARRVKFDGSHVGSMKSEPASQIEVSLGESHPARPAAFGPSAPAHRKSGDRSIPSRKVSDGDN